MLSRRILTITVNYSVMVKNSHSKLLFTSLFSFSLSSWVYERKRSIEIQGKKRKKKDPTLGFLFNFTELETIRWLTCYLNITLISILNLIFEFQSSSFYNSNFTFVWKYLLLGIIILKDKI